MSFIQQTRVIEQYSPRAIAMMLGGFAAIMVTVGSGHPLWLAVCAVALIGVQFLGRIGPLGVLYAFSALLWLLPRLSLPGFSAIVPIHVLLVGGAALIWAYRRLSARSATSEALLPPLWPLVAIYCVGGVIGFATGRTDIDTVNGFKFLMEACGLAPLLYLLAWQYLRSNKEVERLILLLAASTAVLGVIAYIFQGSQFWTPIPFEKEGLRLSGQYQFGGLYVIVTPVMMSTQLSMLIPALTSIAINSGLRKHKAAALGMLVPLVLLILLAAGRSGWMGTTIGVGLVLFFSARAGKVSLPKVGVGIAVAAFLGIAVLVSMGMVNEEISRRILSFGTLLDDDTVVFRYWIWGLGIDLVGQYPLGVGFQVIRGLYGYPAHNSYILWALGTGVAGFAALIALFLTWGVRLLKSLFARQDSMLSASLAALGGVVGALISINGDNVATSVGWTQSTLWLFLGIGAAAFTVARSKSSGQPAVASTGQ